MPESHSYDPMVQHFDSPPYGTQDRKRPMEVLVVGLWRTGTRSITLALTELGYNIYGDDTWIANHAEGFGYAARAKYWGQGRPFELEQWESFFGDYNAIVGYSGAAFFEELAAAYPDAKIILTVRDEDAWLSSITQTVWYNHVRPVSIIMTKIDSSWHTVYRALQPFWDGVFWNSVPRHGRRAFREHNARVQRVIPKERLLVYDVREGWGPLCGFLSKEVPAVPFPNRNNVKEFRAFAVRFLDGEFSKVVGRYVVRGLSVTAVGVALVFVGAQLDGRGWLGRMLRRR